MDGIKGSEAMMKRDEHNPFLIESPNNINMHFINIHTY